MRATLIAVAALLVVSATSLTEVDLRFRVSTDRRLRGGKGVTDQSTSQTIPGLNLPRIQQLDTNGTF